MRTTVRLDDTLLGDAKRYAAENRMTLTAVLHLALRELLLRNRQLKDRQTRADLPTFGGRGLQPGVDLDDSAALLDLMDSADEAS